MDATIGQRLFTDGSTRPVFLDQDSRQYVLDDDGQRICGNWIWPLMGTDGKPVDDDGGPLPDAVVSAS